MITPQSMEALWAGIPGQQYTPSNGTEGEVFLDEWCRNCARDKSMREGAPLEDCDDNERCDIIAASYRGEAKEWVYGSDGQPKCTAYHALGMPAPYRCAATGDMFPGVEGGAA